MQWERERPNKLHSATARLALQPPNPRLPAQVCSFFQGAAQSTAVSALTALSVAKGRKASDTAVVSVRTGCGVPVQLPVVPASTLGTLGAEEYEYISTDPYGAAPEYVK